MCMLAGYVSDGSKGRDIASLLLEALEIQEAYFGAHATGIATIDQGDLRLEKDRGYVARVRKTTNIESLKGDIGIAHSRHGSRYWIPESNTKEKAHPFLDCKRRFALMHNGYVSNFREIWMELEGREHTFRSRSVESDGPAITDSEVAAHLLEEELDKGKNIDDGLANACSRFAGAFLFAAIHKDFPRTIWIANWHQPLAIAFGDGEALFASYELGFSKIRDDLPRVFYPPKNSVIALSSSTVEIKPLLPMRKVPTIRVDIEVLGEEIVRDLRVKGERNIVQLGSDLAGEGWGKALGISSEDFKALMRDGVEFVREYFDALNRLVRQGRIVQRISRGLEAGVEDTPRYSYRLA